MGIFLLTSNRPFACFQLSPFKYNTIIIIIIINKNVFKYI